LTLGGMPDGGSFVTGAETDAILCNNDDLALGALFEWPAPWPLRCPPGAEIGICAFNDLEMMRAYRRSQACAPPLRM